MLLKCVLQSIVWRLINEEDRSNPNSYLLLKKIRSVLSPGEGEGGVCLGTQFIALVLIGGLACMKKR